MQVVLPHMLEKGGGVIVNVASGAVPVSRLAVSPPGPDLLPGVSAPLQPTRRQKPAVVNNRSMTLQ